MKIKIKKTREEKLNSYYLSPEKERNYNEVKQKAREFHFKVKNGYYKRKIMKFIDDIWQTKYYDDNISDGFDKYWTTFEEDLKCRNNRIKIKNKRNKI